MSGDRFMWTLFCDDVRQEAGGKLAYLGIYGINLLVPNYPAHLLKLCAVMTMRTMAARPPSSVAFKLLRDEELIYEHAIDPIAIKNVAAAVPKDDTKNLHITLGAIAQLVNLTITERCVLQARAVVDGEELPGGTLELCALEVSSPPTREK